MRLSTRVPTTLLLVLALASCATPRVHTSLPATWYPSPNAEARRPNFVIIHHTSDDTVDEALHTLTDPLRQVSVHYLVGRDGALYQLVDERRRAWHAGTSYWGGSTDINSASIGIELDNNGSEPFPDPQIAALLALLDDLKRRYEIPAANFLGHADVAPRRKADPSRWFPWKMLAEHGFGLWCDAPPDQAPSGLDPLLALQALGYDVSDPLSAVAAFKLHFSADDPGQQLNEQDLARLACLVQLKRP